MDGAGRVQIFFHYHAAVHRADPDGLGDCFALIDSVKAFR